MLRSEVIRESRAVRGSYPVLGHGEAVSGHLALVQIDHWSVLRRHKLKGALLRFLQRLWALARGAGGRCEEVGREFRVGD